MAAQSFRGCSVKIAEPSDSKRIIANVSESVNKLCTIPIKNTSEAGASEVSGGSVGEYGVLHHVQEAADGFPVGAVIDPEAILLLNEEAVAVHLAEDPGHMSGVHA